MWRVDFVHAALADDCSNAEDANQFVYELGLSSALSYFSLYIYLCIFLRFLFLLVLGCAKIYMQMSSQTAAGDNCFAAN